MAVFTAMGDANERLRIARQSAGYATASDAARAMGIKTPTYLSHENGSIGMRASVAEKYARKFKVSLDWLLTGRGEMSPDGVVPHDFDVEGLPLLGTIQAGHWLETADVHEGADTEMVAIVRDQRFPYAKQYALRVVGDSMDKEYPDGSIVTCVDFADSGLELAEGMIVHVERLRAAGQLREVTLKAVERRRGVLCLVPRSSNPKWQPIPLHSNSDGDEVVARGVVLGGWRPLPLPGR